MLGIISFFLVGRIFVIFSVWTRQCEINIFTSSEYLQSEHISALSPVLKTNQKHSLRKLLIIIIYLLQYVIIDY